MMTLFLIRSLMMRLFLHINSDGDSGLHVKSDDDFVTSHHV